jgi:dTDP-4-amino-4,6-dideoxygalactose transaminase
MSAFDVVRDFEKAIASYCGAPYAVTTTSCTSALLISLNWFASTRPALWVEIPKLTYVGVPMSVVNSGHKLKFRDEDWQGAYRLYPYPLFDSARRLRKGMYEPGTMICLSLHWSKHLGVSQGGVILTDDDEAVDYLKRARFDGRREGIAPMDDTFDLIGHHCYMAPATAAEGLTRLALLPNDNADLPRSEYADLSLAPCFFPYRVDRPNHAIAAE